MALKFRALDITSPVNRLKAGFVAMACNVRAYLDGGFALRNSLTPPLVLTNAASSQVSAGTTGQTGVGAAWNNPANIFDTGSVNFTNLLLGGGNPTVSEILNVTDLGFAIPGSATITGIQFQLQSLPALGHGVAITFQPTQNGANAGTPTTQTLGPAPGGPVTIGGPGNLFGFAWTPALINGATGLGLNISGAGGAAHTSAACELNSLVVTVFYNTNMTLILPAPPHSIRRLNDSTPNGPSSGYALVVGAGTDIYLNSTQVASGLSGNQISLIPFRPNASVQPWMYWADSAAMGNVTLNTKYLINGKPVNFVSNGMGKTRSDGLTYKMGIEEPQLAPIISTAPSSVSVGGLLQATDIPWTNYLGQNPGYNYGESNGPPNPGSPNPIDGTPPFIVDVANASTVTVTAITGTATINGTSAVPTSPGPTPGSTNPGGYVQVGGVVPGTVSVVVGAFTDGDGNVVPLGVAPLYITSVIDVGGNIGVAIPVPFGAQQFQIGINSTGNTFNANSGSFQIEVTVTTNALPTVTSILGDLTCAYFDDSPTSGPVASYIWKNPDDPGGSGPTRSVSDAVGTTTGDSFIFDATFTAGIPGLPGIGSPTVPMLWTDLNPDSVAVGSNPIFAAPLTKTNPTNTQFANFNFCLTGNIYFPSAGLFTLVLTSHDDVIWGIGGGVSLVSAVASGVGEGGGVAISGYGQTITVVGGYPLLPRQIYTSGLGGNYAQTTVVVSVPAAGIYPIELDFDYWFHSGRILLLEGSATAGGPPTIIPPLPASVRQETQYRYVYRSSATGALSNPSPESAAETVPVTANTVTSYWSPDPQVDVVDYYRIDSVTSDFTYVATGPNDNLGPGGTNTPITDSLLDTELGSQLLEFDNFEPFPSIDLPQKGICNVSGGVITWVSGGAIGGAFTGFNIRWLGGTVILIGSPTSLAYTLIARPTSTTTITIPDVPDGTNLAYEIPEPILAAQPLPYVDGPTDNIPFANAVGDPLRGGTFYWSKGNNLDSAPDTNQQDITDPSETLNNLAITTGKVLLGSIKRFWAILPNFFNALATATGTSGSTWSTRLTSIDRGLFIPRCICVSGGGGVFFRVDDGIHYSPSGISSKSITDETLYPLFPHESPGAGASSPQPITRNGITIYPPDDTKPQLQKMAFQNGYMYFKYSGTDGNPHTLVFDEAAMGWIWDIKNPEATCYAANEGESIQGTLVGCFDGSVRLLSSAGTEVVTGTALTAAIGGVGWNHMYEITIEYESKAAVTLSFIAADVNNGSYAPNPIVLPATAGGPTKFTTKVTANKWQLLQAQFQSADPAMAIYLEGVFGNVKDWGTTAGYRPVNFFIPAGGAGGQP
jgi:hypothetical protein